MGLISSILTSCTCRRLSRLVTNVWAMSLDPHSNRRIMIPIMYGGRNPQATRLNLRFQELGFFSGKWPRKWMSPEASMYTQKQTLWTTSTSITKSNLGLSAHLVGIYILYWGVFETVIGIGITGNYTSSTVTPSSRIASRKSLRNKTGIFCVRTLHPHDLLNERVILNNTSLHTLELAATDRHHSCWTDKPPQASPVSQLSSPTCRTVQW